MLDIDVSPHTLTSEWIVMNNARVFHNNERTPHLASDRANQTQIEHITTPHIISTDALIGVTDDVNLALPLTSSLKSTIRHKR